MTDKDFPRQRLDEPTRQRVLAALHREITRAVEDAVSRGVSRDAINAYLDRRAADLVSLGGKESSVEIGDPAVPEDVQHDRDDPIELGRIGG